MNPRKAEVELPVVAEEQADVTRTAQPEREEAPATEQTEPSACVGPGAESFLFDDPYWDDAFDTYHNPTLRTCCRS